MSDDHADDSAINDDNDSVATKLKEQVLLLDSYIKRFAELKETSFARYTVSLPELLKVLKENGIAITRAKLEKAISHQISVNRLQSSTKTKEKDNEDGVKFAPTIHCTEPVDGRALVNALREIIDRHIIFVRSGSSLVISLWCIGTHIFDTWRIFPRLFVTASDSECGKTTVMDIIELLVRRAKKVENITPAAVFRVIEQYRPTLLIDEADVCVKDSDEMRGVINSEHKKDGNIVRAVPDGDGGYTTKEFSTSAPMALAAIGTLQTTIMNRSIIIPMSRKKRDETVVPFSDENTQEFDQLRSQSARWGGDNADALTSARPAMPDSIINRTGDNWRPLFAIADAVSDECGSEIRHIALDWTSQKTESSHGIMMLSDIRDLFLETGLSALRTTYIMERLHDMHNRPWPECGKDRAQITTYRFHQLLHPYKIKTNKAVRLDDGTVEKGFKRAEFEDVFNRYLPPVTTIDDDVWEGLDGAE